MSNALTASDLPAEVSGDAVNGEWNAKSISIVVLCFALNMVDGMDVLSISYIAPALQKEWGIGAGAFAAVFSAGLAGMALGGLGLAPLADRFGRRRLIVLAISLMAASMLVSSYARSVTELAAIRFVVGIGIGTVLACIAAVAARFAPLHHRNFAVGILQGGYPIGAMITGFVTAWALPIYGWRDVLVGAAVISALFIPLIMLIMPARMESHHGQPAVPLGEIVAGAQRKNSLLLWTSTICGFMALYFIASWITKLSIEAGLPETQAIISSAIYNFGAFSGTLGMSLVGTRWDIRKIASNLLVAAIAVFLIFGGVPMGLSLVLVTAFFMGVTLQGGFNTLYPIAANVYPDRVRATGIGWAFGIGRIGAFTGPLVGGWALGINLPLVAVFAIFCVPLAIAAIAVRRVRFSGDAKAAAVYVAVDPA